MMAHEEAEAAREEEKEEEELRAAQERVKILEQGLARDDALSISALRTPDTNEVAGAEDDAGSVHQGSQRDGTAVSPLQRIAPARDKASQSTDQLKTKVSERERVRSSMRALEAENEQQRSSSPVPPSAGPTHAELQQWKLRALDAEASSLPLTLKPHPHHGPGVFPSPPGSNRSPLSARG